MSGIEWLVEAFGCAEAALSDPTAFCGSDIDAEMRLEPVGGPMRHRSRRAEE